MPRGRGALETNEEPLSPDAHARDRAGDERDDAAEQRDQAAEARDEAAQQSESAIRARIMEALDLSAQARREAASDRSRSEADRTTALADRGASARERADASIDDLTGVYVRGAGLVELERDIARARRDQHSLVLAFIDVDGLKATNDSRGHAAGDRVLREVATTLRAKLRPYDLIIRYGGDEFLCAISSIALPEATIRLGLVNAALAARPEQGSVSIGVAQLRPDDSTDALVERADVALYADRAEKRPLPSS